MVNRRGGRGLPHGGFALAPAARNALGPRKPFGVSTRDPSVPAVR